MHILGINAYHPNSSACIVKDGQLIAAAEEERFRRIKHWAGFPAQAIRYCLNEAGVGLKDIDYIGVSRDPWRHLHKKILLALRRRLPVSLLKLRLENLARIQGMRETLCSEFRLLPNECRARIYNIEHHRAHIASSFFLSGFNDAAVLSIDAMGDFVSTMWGRARGNKIKVMDWIEFPHSLGFFYSAATQFLGFIKFGDEFKVMGLSAYGQPRYVRNLKKILIFDKEGKFRLKPEYFSFYSTGIKMLWDNQEPEVGTLYSEKWITEFGPPRHPEEELTQHYKDIAASLQALLEEAYFYILNHLYAQTKVDRICLAGGVALNCAANGKILENTHFKEIYIQPAANDAGTSLGAAYYIYHQILNQPKNFTMQHSYWGPEFTDQEIKILLEKHGIAFKRYEGPELIIYAAQALAAGKIVGWFQQRMEWGPRSLGNRSILADPRRSQMKDTLNARVKHREPFRPFAPSILKEDVAEYFAKEYDSPFMLLSLPVCQEKVNNIVASAHIDGTARLQTVSKTANPIFWQLINEFKKITKVPVLLNTSFNENEPMVCAPNEALDCFLRTKMDILIISNFVIEKA
ncbi:carbamoyltransferase [bacterium]|nr:MAG: carbamoyltransferase [bacterium]